MAPKKKMNIIFISSLQYPEGGASANRHLAYAKGLSEIGNKVCFILTSPQNGAEIEIPGIKFLKSLPDEKKLQKKRPLKEALKKQYQSISETKKNIIEEHTRHPIDIVVLLDTFAWQLYNYIRFFKKLGIIILHERTEYPFLLNNESLIKKIDLYLYYKLILPKINGLFVISNALKRYFEADVKLKVPIVVINMIVDPSRFFTDEGKSLKEENYIAYCGSMGGDKDGVETLIKAFGLAIHNYSFCKDLKLKLIGDISDIELASRLKKAALDSDCLNEIIFTGSVERSFMPSLLANAKALLLARPANKQAEGGFPTKLGEYLATGKPVIITRVGEIGLFLKDGKNAFLAMPNNANDFAVQIGNVFRNYSSAITIGNEGKKLIYNEFNYKVQARVLESFMRQLNNKYES